jgi:hypothetical protein
MAAMPFEVVVHREDRILEVIYPAKPSATDITDYMDKVKKGIDAMEGGKWSSLVDQTRLQTLSSDLLKVVTQMNAYAANRGMIRTARVVVDAVASLQAWRMGKDANIDVPLQTFQTREDALEWIRGENRAG